MKDRYITMMTCKAICSVVVRWDLEGNSVSHSFKYRTVLVCFSVDTVVVLASSILAA